MNYNDVEEDFLDNQKLGRIDLCAFLLNLFFCRIFDIKTNNASTKKERKNVYFQPMKPARLCCFIP